MFRTSNFLRLLSMNSINPSVIKAEYAVRGPIVQRAEEIKAQLMTTEGRKKYPFESIVMCNIGNPQALQQPPISFYREVLSLIVNPLATLTEDKVKKDALLKLYNPESVERALLYLKNIGYWTTTGAYTVSKGFPWVRQQLCRWMEKRDAGAKFPVKPHLEEFILSNGASSGCSMILQAFKGAGSVMIPVPQYPLYTATLALLNTPYVPYYLNEGKGWGLDLAELERSISGAKDKPTALVVINPGNPTGQVLDTSNIREVIEFCYKNEITLISDEVYQENIYTPHKKFHSFRKVLMSIEDEKVRTGLQLISFHSTSKGIIGECGRRGGYMHMMNFAPEVMDQINKLQSIQLCPNVDGQVLVALMTDPPVAEAAEQFATEYKSVFDGYKRKARLLCDSLNKVKGIASNDAEGAMYLFPSIQLPQKYISHANSLGFPAEKADACWTLELLESKGIVVVPGSGFGQVPGTYHFRTTILPQDHEIKRCADAIASFHTDLMSIYQ